MASSGAPVPRRVCARPPGQDGVSVAQRFRAQLGWSVAATDTGVFLSLGNGMVGVIVPPAVASNVFDLLRRRGTVGPVLSVTNGRPCWIFLAESNGLIVSRDDLPPNVVVLSCPSRVRLPTAAQGPISWVRQPDPRDRWLPTLDAVVAAVRDVQRLFVP